MEYEKGCQPCGSYTPRLTEYGSSVHECYSPRADGERCCEGKVSFCENCRTDHHSGGYQTCAGTWHSRNRSIACPKCVAAKASK